MVPGCFEFHVQHRMPVSCQRNKVGMSTLRHEFGMRHATRTHPVSVHYELLGPVKLHTWSCSSRDVWMHSLLMLYAAALSTVLCWLLCVGCAKGYTAQMCTRATGGCFFGTCSPGSSSVVKLLCIACKPGYYSEGGTCTCKPCTCPAPAACRVNQVCSTSTGLCALTQAANGAVCTTTAGEAGTCTSGNCVASECAYPQDTCAPIWLQSFCKPLHMWY